MMNKQDCRTDIGTWPRREQIHDTTHIDHTNMWRTRAKVSEQMETWNWNLRDEMLSTGGRLGCSRLTYRGQRTTQGTREGQHTVTAQSLVK